MPPIRIPDVPILGMETMGRTQALARGAHPQRPAEWAIYLTWPEGFDVPDLPAAGDLAPGIVIGAQINHGRWVVECQTCAPRAGQIAAPTDPRFLCHKCFNADYEGKWLRVRYPLKRPEIEAALMPRPVEARNWQWGVAPERLLAENATHKL